MVFQHRKQLAADPTNSTLIKFPNGMTLGVPILIKMEVVCSSSRYLVTHHKPSVKEGAKETFLYSPFVKKKTEQKESIYAAHEMVHIDVTLANPFLFEIDVQMLAVCADDLEFKPLSVSTLIPAETSSLVVRLSCIPQKEGILNLTGVKIRMMSGSVEEFILPLQRHLSNLKKFSSDGKLKRQSDQDRFGKKPLEFISGPKPDSSSQQ